MIHGPATPRQSASQFWGIVERTLARPTSAILAVRSLARRMLGDFKSNCSAADSRQCHGRQLQATQPTDAPGHAGFTRMQTSYSQIPSPPCNKGLSIRHLQLMHKPPGCQKKYHAGRTTVSQTFHHRPATRHQCPHTVCHGTTLCRHGTCYYHDPCWAYSCREYNHADTSRGDLLQMRWDNCGAEAHCLHGQSACHLETPSAVRDKLRAREHAHGRCVGYEGMPGLS